MNTDPATYAYRTVLLGQDPNATLRVLTIDAGCEPDALMLDMFRDVIADRAHLLLAAQDRAGLVLASAAFRTLAQQAPRLDH